MESAQRPYHERDAGRKRHSRAELQHLKELAEAPTHPEPFKGTYGEWSEKYLRRKIPRHQNELAEELLRSPLSESMVDLEPRGHGKSTTGSNGVLLFIQCESTCEPLNDYLASWLQGPNDLRILHISASKDLDKLYIRAMKRTLENNPHIMAQYGLLIEPPGSIYQYNLKDRVVRKEPTIMGTGIGSDIIGHHEDLICVDDCIQDDNPRDLKVREKKKDWVDETLEGCVDPNTKVWWIGTRKSMDDIYKYVMGKPGTSIRIRQAIIREACPHCGTELTGSHYNVDLQWMVCPHCLKIIPLEEVDSEVLWEEERPYPWLVKKRAKMGSFKFSREMQNKPVAVEGALLKKEWLKEYARPPIPQTAYRGQVFAGVDPALGEKERADYTTIVTVLKWENKLYMLDVLRGRWTFPKTKEMIMQNWVTYSPVKIGIESNFYQRALSQHLLDTTLLPIVEVKHLKDKVTRIMSTLGVYAESGRLIINRSLPYKDQFLAEYLDFPDGEHDDILDALATAVEVAVKPVGAVLFV